MILSIIVPIYNVEQYLNKCFNTLINQQSMQIEFICIDDGSTDKSGDICDEFAKKDRRFKVVHKRNEGVSSARNLGLKIAKGKYIAWVDPDDYISLKWFKIIEKYLNNDIDIIFFDYALINNKKRYNVFFDKKNKNIKKDIFLRDLVLDKVKSHLWQMIFKKDIIQNIRFPIQKRFMEDFSVLHKIILKADKIFYIHEVLYFYRIRNNSLTNTWNIEQNYEAYTIAKERYDYLIKRGYNVSKVGYLIWALNICSIYYKKKEQDKSDIFVFCKREIDKNIKEILETKECNRFLKLKFWLCNKNLLKLSLNIKKYICYVKEKIIK